MNTKKMLAILAALSMLGTTGLTVGAEDTAATEPTVETVVTTEATAHAHPEHKSPSSGTPLYPKQKQPFRKLQKQEQKPLLWMKQKWKSTKLR